MSLVRESVRQQISLENWVSSDAYLGQCTLLFGCGLLLGQPIAGTILSSTGQYLGKILLSIIPSETSANYTQQCLGTKIWCSAMITAGAGAVIFARIAKAGTGLMVKV
jgi:hypothetical protein